MKFEITNRRIEDDKQTVVIFYKYENGFQAANKFDIKSNENDYEDWGNSWGNHLDIVNNALMVLPNQLIQQIENNNPEITLLQTEIQTLKSQLVQKDLIIAEKEILIADKQRELDILSPTEEIIKGG